MQRAERCHAVAAATVAGAQPPRYRGVGAGPVGADVARFCSHVVLDEADILFEDVDGQIKLTEAARGLAANSDRQDYEGSDEADRFVA